MITIMDTVQSSSSSPSCTADNATLDRVQMLHVNLLIDHWPNFTNCLPHCGMCQVFAGDASYSLFNLLFVGCCLPVIGALGLVGNGFSAFVYSRPEMRNSTNLYLCALGCSDSAVIVTAIFLFSLDSIRRYSHMLSVIVGTLSPVVYPAGMAAQTCSVYFTLAAGIDCFVHVCLPERCRRVADRRRTINLVIGMVVVFSLLYNIPHCFEAVVIQCWHLHWQAPSLEVCADPFRYVPSYVVVYYTYMYAIFLAVGPLIVLVFLNICIIIASLMIKTGDTGDTIALVLVVLLFILCNTAALLLNVFDTQLGELFGPYVNYVVDASNVMVVFNSSFNFVIYYTFSNSFRMTMKKYFGCMPRSKQVEDGFCSTSGTRRRSIHRVLAIPEPEGLI